MTSHSCGLLITMGSWQEGGHHSPSPASSPADPPASWFLCSLLPSPPAETVSMFCSFPLSPRISLSPSSMFCSFPPSPRISLSPGRCLLESIRFTVFERLGFSVELELCLRDCCSQCDFSAYPCLFITRSFLASSQTWNFLLSHTYLALPICNKIEKNIILIY